MRDVLEDLIGWWQAGETVGMGTVVATWKSAPRQAGAAMLVGPDGSAVGSVSGGCVEGAVYDLAKTVVDARGLLASGRSELLTYGPEGQRRGEGMRVFCASYAPKPRMLVFGAIDFADRK